MKRALYALIVLPQGVRKILVQRSGVLTSEKNYGSLAFPLSI